MLQISHAASADAKRSVFYGTCGAGVLRADGVRQTLTSKWLSSERGPLFGRLLQLYVELHVCSKHHSRGGLHAKLLIRVHKGEE